MKIEVVHLPIIEGNTIGLNGCQDPIKVRVQVLGFRYYIFTIMSPFADGEGLATSSGPPGSGQFNAPGQVPFQATFPQMWVGSPPGPHVSVNAANIQQMDQHSGQAFENWLKSTISQTKSMAAGISAGNYPQAAYASSSHNVEKSDSMNAGMANLSLNDLQPQVPTHSSPPTSLSSGRQIGLSLTDQMGSSNPSTSNLSPYNNAVQQGSHFNPSMAPRMNEPNTMLSPFPLPTETRPYGSNPNRPPPPASTSPFNPPPSFSGGPTWKSNIYDGNGNLKIDDHSTHRTNIDSFNERNNTVRDSFNDNSLVDSTGKHYGMFYSIDMPIVIGH